MDVGAGLAIQGDVCRRDALPGVMLRGELTEGLLPRLEAVFRVQLLLPSKRGQDILRHIDEGSRFEAHLTQRKIIACAALPIELLA